MKQKSIKRNMIMNTILTISNFIFPLITFSYISRTLTPIGTGKVAFVSSVLSYFIYLASLGIPTYGLREASKIRDDKDKLSKLVHELLIISLISTIISYLVLFICVIFIGKLNNYKLLFVIMSSSILLNSIGLEWLYKALEEYSYITTRSLIFKVIYIPLVFLLIHSESDYLWYGFLSIFVTSANYICNFINSKKYINYKKYSNYNFKRHLKPIFILFSSTIIISIYANFDVMMLGFLRTEFDVGLYNTALKIKDMVVSVSTSITTVLIPRIAYFVNKKDDNMIKDLSLKSLKVSALFALPLAIYVLLYPANILIFLCGKDFIGAVSTLRILSMCGLCLIITNLFGNQLLIPLGREKKFTTSVFIGMIINLILNFLLIPKYGSAGAAIGTLVTEIWNVIFMGVYCKEYSSYIVKNSKIYKYLFSVVISSIISYVIFCNINQLLLFYQLAITAIVYFGIYYLVLLLLKEDLLKKEVSNVIKKIKRGN